MLTQQAQAVLRLYDESFNLIAVESLDLPSGAHQARFVFELFPEVLGPGGNFRGSLTVQSDVPLAAVTLRQNDDPALGFPDEVPTLSAFPVIPGRAGESAASSGALRRPRVSRPGNR